MAAHGIGYTKTGADNVAVHVEVMTAGTFRRFKWFEISWANTATPADNLYQYVVRRITTSGTGTAATPSPYDPADVAVPVYAAKHLVTVDSSTFAAGGELYREPLNARASFRWVANPGREFVCPGATGNGIGFGLSAVSTSTFAGSLGVEEQ